MAYVQRSLCILWRRTSAVLHHLSLIACAAKVLLLCEATRINLKACLKRFYKTHAILHTSPYTLHTHIEWLKYLDHTQVICMNFIVAESNLSALDTHYMLERHYIHSNNHLQSMEQLLFLCVFFFSLQHSIGLAVNEWRQHPVSHHPGAGVIRLAKEPAYVSLAITFQLNISSENRRNRQLSALRGGFQ